MTTDTLELALLSEKETSAFDFKTEFNVRSDQAWCGIIKDVVAMSNSGGGVIIIGVDDNGMPSGADITPVLSLDPADVTNRLNKYLNRQFSKFTIQRCDKSGSVLAAIIIHGADVPYVFEKPGTYVGFDGKEKSAFAMGTVYFRHGAKSEPGNNEDLRLAVERLRAAEREGLLKNLRQVVEAPPGSTVVTFAPGDDPGALPVRVSSDPNAPVIGAVHPDRTHPYRQKELIEEVNKRLPSGKHINQYDIQCVRKLYEIDQDVNLHYRPLFGGHQYSPAFADWLIFQFQRDSEFFQSARHERAQQRLGRNSS